MHDSANDDVNQRLTRARKRRRRHRPWWRKLFADSRSRQFGLIAATIIVSIVVGLLAVGFCDAITRPGQGSNTGSFVPRGIGGDAAYRPPAAPGVWQATVS